MEWVLTRVDCSRVETVTKLAALVPPPRLNLIRYHGILAPRAHDRAQIVPQAKHEPEAKSESARPACTQRSGPAGDIAGEALWGRCNGATGGGV